METLMNLTNDSYTILIGGKNWTELYYRDRAGWLKVSARGRKFRATAEQILNHVLPALAGVKANVTLRVEHHETARQAADFRRGLPERRAPVLGRSGAQC